MEEKIFHRDEYPMDILGEFGLTQEMIYDLPDFVHDTIEMGGKSPLLPITIEQPFGVTHAYARFSLVDTDEGVDVLFYPKLREVNLDAFNEMQKRLLLDGKVIVADVEENVITDEGVEDTQFIKAFVQVDKDTNSVIYSPTQVIGRNLNAISNEYDISGDELRRIWDGDLITVTEANVQGIKEPVTIGVDLLTDKGVIVVPGTADKWEKSVRRGMPPYSFGSDGCWVNRDGRLSYVPDAEFTPDILQELERRTKQFGYAERGETIQEERSLQREQTMAEEENRQLTR